jgi:Replication protein
MASLDIARPSPTPAPLFDGAPYDDGRSAAIADQTPPEQPAAHQVDDDDTRPSWELPAEHLPIEQSYRHAWWASRRRRTYDALNVSGVSSRRLVNFQMCGSMAMVEVEQKTGAVRVSSCKCHDRMCQACGEEKARTIATALHAKCLQSKTLHAVLTLVSTDDSLGACVDRLYKCFAKLRSRPWWKLHATGGAYSFEATWNKDTCQWHPHLHVLVHADYLDQRTLRSEWLAVTGDSHVCNVSLVGKGEAAAREVTKYISKPIHRSVDGNQDLIIHLATELKGRRMITTFGSWRGVPLNCYVPELDGSKWVQVCTLIELHRRAGEGDEWSVQTLRYLHSKRPGRIHAAAPTATPPPLPHAASTAPAG